MAMLERDLKTLRRSKMMDYSEFRVMLTELEKYFMEIKTEVMIGKKQVREIDMRPFLYDDGDTYEKPFFGILSKMLYEVAMCKSLGKQEDDLRKIYQWFNANKKVLTAEETNKPHFGQQTDYDNDAKDEEHKFVKVPKLRMRPKTAPPVESSKGVRYMTWNSVVNGNHDKRPGSGRSSSRKSSNHNVITPRPPSAQKAFSRTSLSSSLMIKPALNTQSPCTTPRNFNGHYSRLYVGPSHLRRPGTAPPTFRNYKLHSSDDPDGLTSTFILRPRHPSPCPVPSPVSSPASSPKSTPRSHSPITAVYSPDSQKEPAIKVHIRFPKQDSNHEDEDKLEVEISENNNKINGHVPDAMKHASPLQCSQYLKQQQRQSELLEEQNELLERKLLQEQEKKRLQRVSGETENEGHIENVSPPQQNGESHSPRSLVNGTRIPMSSVSAYDLSESDVIQNYSAVLSSEDLDEELSWERLTVNNNNNTPLSGHSSIRHIKSASGLTNSGGVNVGDMLKLVSPVGQQLNFEREVLSSDNPSPGFRQPSLTVPVTARPQQRAVSAPTARQISNGYNSPVRTTTPDFKPELSQRDYTVHFHQQSETPSEIPQEPKPYKISGPVVPDTVRYQWTDDGFGNRTFVKKLKSAQSPRAPSAKKLRPASTSLAKSMNIESVSIRPNSRQLDTRTIASAMVVRHLGSSGNDRRTKDRFDEETRSVPVTWEYYLDVEPPPDPTSYNLQYMSFVQPVGPPIAEEHGTSHVPQTPRKEKEKPVDVFEPIRGLDVRVEEDKNLMILGKHLPVTSPEKDEKTSLHESPESGRSTSSSVNTLTVRPMWATEELRSSTESLNSVAHRDGENRENGGEEDVDSRPESEMSIHLEEPDSTLNNQDRMYSLQKRISGSQLYSMAIQKAPIYDGPPEDPIPNKLFACHHTGRASPVGTHHTGRTSPIGSQRSSSRSTSPVTKIPSRCTSPTPMRPNTPNDKADFNFNVKDFSHFCWNDDPELETDVKRQREIWAAVNIQRIFRGHMARVYLKDLKAKDKNRRQKAAVAVQSAFRGFMIRKRMMEKKLKNYVPSSSDIEWARKYKEELRRREEMRSQKNKSFIRFQNLENSKNDEQLKQLGASFNIQKIFNPDADGPTKAEKHAAATSIQRFVKGWFTRKMYSKVKEKALKRTLDFNKFIQCYTELIVRIQQRYGVENIRQELDWSDLMEYVDRLNKYEIAFSKLAVDGVLKYEDLEQFFEELGLNPSQREIDAAIQAVTGESPEGRCFTKAEAVEIVFQIYIPKGTGLKLTDVRKSTWLNPLIDGQDISSLLTKKQMEETSLAKVMKVLMDHEGDGSEIKGLLRPSSAEPAGRKSPRSRSKSPQGQRRSVRDPGGVILAQYPLNRPKSAQSTNTNPRPSSPNPPVILAQYPLNRPDSSKAPSSRPSSSRSTRSNSPRNKK